MEKLKQIQPKVYWMALAFCLTTTGSRRSPVIINCALLKMTMALVLV